MAQAPTKNPLISQWPSPERCAGDGCTAGIYIWPLFYARQGGVYCRLCSSCLLLSYRSLYCCCCFLLLGSSSPSRHEVADPLISAAAPTVTCLVCHGAVAHLSCLRYSTPGVFVCPACSAATAGRPFSYAPSCNEPIDVAGSRVFLLATRMSLALLQKYAAEAKALAERTAAAAAEARKQAYLQLGLAYNVDLTLPSTNEDITPPENMGPECSEANMRFTLDLNEPAPPPSPATLMIGQDVGEEMATAYADTLPSLSEMPRTGIEGVCRAPPPSPATLTIGEEDDCAEMAIACAESEPVSMATSTTAMEHGCTEVAMVSADPPLLSMATPTTGMDAVCTELAMASAEPPLLSVATLGGVSRDTVMASAEPPLLSLATDGSGMEGVSREMAMAPAKGPPRRTLELFWEDEEEHG